MKPWDLLASMYTKYYSPHVTNSPMYSYIQDVRTNNTVLSISTGALGTREHSHEARALL